MRLCYHNDDIVPAAASDHEAIAKYGTGIILFERQQDDERFLIVRWVRGSNKIAGGWYKPSDLLIL